MQIFGGPKEKKNQKKRGLCLNQLKGRDICRSFGFVSGLRKCVVENSGRDFVSAGGMCAQMM
jgi:hypothetical protein